MNSSSWVIKQSFFHVLLLISYNYFSELSTKQDVKIISTFVLELEQASEIIDRTA